MSDCNSIPFKGEQSINFEVEFKAKNEEVAPFISDLEKILDNLKTKLEVCCVDIGTNLDSLTSKMNQILTINEVCCEDINNNLELIVDALCDISETIEICDD